MIAILKRAGVTPDEVQRDPVIGIVLSHTAVRKMCSQASDKAAATALMRQVTAAMRKNIRVVPKGATDIGKDGDHG